jgi:hypothetical protein
MGDTFMKQFTLLMYAYCAAFVVALLAVGAAGYAVVHFLAKFW